MNTKLPPSPYDSTTPPAHAINAVIVLATPRSLFHVDLFLCSLLVIAGSLPFSGAQSFTMSEPDFTPAILIHRLHRPQSHRLYQRHQDAIFAL